MYHDRSIYLRTLLLFSTFILFAILLSCEEYDDPTVENWDDEELDERATVKESGCEGECSSSCRCAWTEIGCNSDQDCQSGLYCKMRPTLGNLCLKKKNDGGDNTNNNDNNGDCHEFKPGHGSYCSSACPCNEGEGDCDDDSQCKSGLVCKQQSGTDFCVKSGGGGNDGDCHEFKPGHGSYCSSSCRCNEGEGDCDDDSQCNSGLVCKQQSGTDFCVKSDGGGNDTGGDDSGVSNNLSTNELVKQMARQNKVFVFDKDKTLLGGNTSKIKELLRMITDAGAQMAILTSNKTKKDGEYAAIGQLQGKFGKTIFPSSFFRTDAFQVNDDSTDKTKANEMRKIIRYYDVKASDVVFYDDKQYNISDVTKKYAVVGIKVDPDKAMTESDFRKGMLKVLD